MTHAERIADLTSAFNDSMSRLLARLDAATPEQLTKSPDGGGWSPAEIAWHVGVINEAFAGLIDGSIPRARQAPEGFVETPWKDIASQVPVKLEAPVQFHPPAGVSAEDALSKLRGSQQRMVDALAGLEESRSGLTVKSTVGTPVTLYQVGNWATAHVARHNARIKELLATV
jgi:hypothetical protein